MPVWIWLRKFLPSLFNVASGDIELLRISALARIRFKKPQSDQRSRNLATATADRQHRKKDHKLKTLESLRFVDKPTFFGSLTLLLAVTVPLIVYPDQGAA